MKRPAKIKGAQLSYGDRVTIAGISRGAKGQLLIDGVNPKTSRKCRPVKLASFIVQPEMAG